MARAEMTEEEIAAHLSWMPSEEENAAMWAEFARLEAIENKKLEDIKQRVKELCGRKFYTLFLEYLQNMKEMSTQIHSWKLTTEKPYIKKKQRIDEISCNSRITHEYVDQYRNGGMEGDDFAGQIWLHIKGNRYFNFHYRM
jgi:hypothetical protein